LDHFSSIKLLLPTLLPYRKNMDSGFNSLTNTFYLHTNSITRVAQPCQRSTALYGHLQAWCLFTHNIPHRDSWPRGHVFETPRNGFSLTTNHHHPRPPSSASASSASGIGMESLLGGVLSLLFSGGGDPCLAHMALTALVVYLLSPVLFGPPLGDVIRVVGVRSGRTRRLTAFWICGAVLALGAAIIMVMLHV
jgi:hypothetical protein